MIERNVCKHYNGIIFVTSFLFDSEEYEMYFTFVFSDGHTNPDVILIGENGWHHFAIVLLGHSVYNEPILYHNGNKVDGWKSYPLPTTKQSGTGKLIIGRPFLDRNYGYSSTIVDELVFWNRNLTDGEVKSIYDSYNSNDN